LKADFPRLVNAGGLLLWRLEHGRAGAFTAAFSTRVALDTKGPSFIDYGFKGNAGGTVDARKRLCSALDIDFEKITFGEQVHGTSAVEVAGDLVGAGHDSPDTRIPSTDALFTSVPGVAVAVLTADCVPVLLADMASGGVAAVHAGWRGALAGIVENAVALMAGAAGSPPESLLAFIGPSIGPCCFEVKDEVTGSLPGGDACFLAERGGSSFLDLPGLVENRLRKTGVTAANINRAGICTCCNTDLFHSFRGDTDTRGSNISMIFRIDSPGS